MKKRSSFSKAFLKPFCKQKPLRKTASQKERFVLSSILVLAFIAVAVAAPVAAQPPSPFLISGEVNYDTGDPVNNPNVTITNLNTSEVFIAEKNASSNYYPVLKFSWNVSADHVIHFNASDNKGNSTEFNHTVTQGDMNNGGFLQNITISLPAIPMPDLLVTVISAYHNNTGCPPWFNISNEVDVTVKNNGTAPAGASNVSLYIEGVFFGKRYVSNLSAGANETVTFEKWKPIGDDCLLPVCQFNWAYKDYNLTGVADCDSDVSESSETNNETTVVARTCYNGYIADEPLENVAHGMLHGGLLFTTGDGIYTGLYSPGATKDTNYDITLPAGATEELAQLNVYYTWTSPDHSCPEMEVRITNATGTYVVPLEKAYNDIKCTCPGASWIKTWGNYVFNITDYVTGSGTYTVTVENIGSSGHSFCIAAPGIVLVYEDENAPLIEYWVNKGADVLMGGRRYATSSNLAWWECINNATFQASTETGEVVNATLGVVAPWGGSSWSPGMTNFLFFNDVKLGTGVYHGYGETYDETIDSITMHVGSTNAQVGANVSSVTALYLKGSDNVVGQADDGDNTMPANAFLVVEYEETPGICGDVNDDGLVTMGDGRRIYMNQLYGPAQYPIANAWAADVNCDGMITMGDGRKIYMNQLYGAAQYPLNCCI